MQQAFLNAFGFHRSKDLTTIQRQKSPFPRVLREMHDSHSKAPKGLYALANAISTTQEQQLLDDIAARPWNHALSRRTQHYGFEYHYRRDAMLDQALRATTPVPTSFKALWRQLRERSPDAALFPSASLDGPDQVIVNEYKPGQGIASHVDDPVAFGDTVVTLSLGAPAEMVFRQQVTKQTFRTVLQRRMLIVMTGDARYRWTQGIEKKKRDAAGPRGTRVSVTFRSVPSGLASGW